MKPYYQHGGITIYHGDCREILPNLPKVDLVLTDPPYGIDYSPKYVRRKLPNGSWLPKKTMPPVIGDKDSFDPTFLFAAASLQILWGANHYANKLPRNGRWLVWDKRCQIIPSRNQADCEMAWVSEYGAARIIYHYWDGMVKQSERGVQRQHPTQKPLEVMRWCFGFAPNSQRLIDPFMGSGTTLRAAKDLGREAIGIELIEQYCEIAARRLEQECLITT